MILDELMARKGYAVHDIAKMAKVRPSSVDRVLKYGITESKNLIHWCERHGVELNRANKSHQQKLNEALEAQIEKMTQFPVIMKHMLTNSRGLVAIQAEDCAAFERVAHEYEIDVEVFQENKYRKVYHFRSKERKV